MRWVLWVCLVVALAAACATGSEEHVLVLAASSLTDAFHELEEAFEDANPDLDVVISTGGSSTLREQILGGAPADVFASADISNMEEVATAGLLNGDDRVFARNRLQIAVPPGNPAGVSGLNDFANEELLVGLCAEGVPCGDLGREVLRLADVEPSIDTNEPNVRALLTKVEAAELDAAIVYVTDVRSAVGRVVGIEIPESADVLADYPIGMLADAPDPAGARAFISFVLSDAGQSVLLEHGFLPP